MLKTEWSNDYGRYLAAASDIPDKTVILLENVLLYAPADDVKDRIAGNKLFCLVCCRPSEGVHRQCASCGWYICSTACEKMECHKNECEIFAQNKVQFPPPHGWPILNKTILVLRCLLTKIYDPRVWTEFLSKLEHHSDSRGTKSVCKKSDVMITENIQYFYSTSTCPFTEKEIRTMCGVINVNAFLAEKRHETTNEYWKTKCMFEKASLFAHSCSPNCSWNIVFNKDESQIDSPSMKIEVIAAAPIKKGDMLTIFYSTRYAMYGTLKRIVLMEEIAHFLCKCVRCRDKTELETFMSAVKCVDCKKDYLLPVQPTDIHSNWKCLNSVCGNTESVRKIVCKICEIEDYVEGIRDLNLNIDEEVKMLSTVAKKHSGIVLHKNHYVLQEIALKVVQLLVDGGILNDKQTTFANSSKLDILLQQCKYLLNIAYTLLPAMTGYISTLETYLRHAEKIKGTICH